MVSPKQIKEHAEETKALAAIYERYLLELYGWLHEANVENQSSSYESSKDSINDMAEAVHYSRENIDRIIWEAQQDIDKGIYVYQPPKPEPKTVAVSGIDVDYDDIPF